MRARGHHVHVGVGQPWSEMEKCKTAQPEITAHIFQIGLKNTFEA